MTIKSTAVTFRCPNEVLAAIDELGAKLYPAGKKNNGYDRSKTILDILRAGVEALSDGEIALPAPEVKQLISNKLSDNMLDNMLDERMTAIERMTHQLQTELAEVRTGLEGIGSLSSGNDESLRQELQQYQLEEARRKLAEALRQLKEANNSLEIEESNREALRELYAEWKAEEKAEIATLKQQLEEAETKLAESAKTSDNEPIRVYEFLNWFRDWVNAKSAKKAKWEPTAGEVKQLLEKLKIAATIE